MAMRIMNVSYFEIILIITVNLSVVKGKETNPSNYLAEELTQDYKANNTCNMTVTKKSISTFRHIVIFGELTYVYLLLTPKSNNIRIIGSKNVVEENIWVWTFYGKHGSFEFLSWPMEFQIWSMNLLSEYIYGPIEIELEFVDGNCSNLIVGEKESDIAISNALANLTKELSSMSIEKAETYGPSFWCYKKRMFINPRFLYQLCKNIICPIEAIEHSCCSYYYSINKGRREVYCKEETFQYDELWWIIPFVIAVIVFCYTPLLILNLTWRFSLSKETGSSEVGSGVENSTYDEYLFIDNTYKVTFFGTLLYPLRHFDSSIKCVSRTIRFILPFVSLLFVAVQILLDYIYMPYFLKHCVSKGVPLGFRSMLAGYKESEFNFLSYLGGPYIAVSLYLLIGITLLALPPSLSTLLVRGLPEVNRTDQATRIDLCLTDVECYGSVPIRKRQGYYRVYSFMLGKFYTILNPKFWKFVFNSQCDRWEMICQSRLRFTFLPFYVTFCFLEILLYTLTNSFPIATFSAVMVRAYYRTLTRHTEEGIGTCKYYFLSSFILSAIIYFMFMFSIIFMDAALFISRVFIFTYTGIIIYPRESYGYLILVCTFIYYLWDCIKEFSRVYQNLLKTTVKVCESIQRANDRDQLVVNKNRLKGVKVVLFEHVIEMHCPRRKQMFVSLLKLTIILTIIGISLDLLMKTDTFQKLHVVMHVGTALFTCILPQIVKSLCTGPDDNIKHKKFKLEIKRTIKDFLGYFEQMESDDELNSVNDI